MKTINFIGLYETFSIMYLIKCYEGIDSDYTVDQFMKSIKWHLDYGPAAVYDFNVSEDIRYRLWR